MLGYIIKAVNTKTGAEYISKVLAVKFKKEYLGNNMFLIKDAENTGLSFFDIQMIKPCETVEEAEMWYRHYAPAIQPPKEETAKPKRTRKKAKKDE